MSRLIVALDWDGKYLKAANMQQVGLTNQQVIGGNITTYLDPDEWLDMVEALKKGRSLKRLQQYNTPIGLTQQLVHWERSGRGKRQMLIGTVDQLTLVKPASVMPITAQADICTDGSVKLGHNGNNQASVLPESFCTMRPSFDLSPQEYQVLQWLSKAQEIETLEVKWHDRGVAVQCADTMQAYRLSDALDLLVSTELKWVRIYVGRRCFSGVSLDKLRGSTSSASNSMLTATVETMPSIWARQNVHVFQAIPGTVALLSADPDHRYLALKPEIAEGRLNKPINALLNQPLYTIDEELWVPRKRAIDSVLETGENEVYYYTHFWENLLWHFKCTVAKASDSELMTIVEDAEDHAHWQKKWWQNRVSVSA